MNYGHIVMVSVSAPYPEMISWISPWLFQAPYPCLSPCPGPFPCLYLCPGLYLGPCLCPCLCSPFLSLSHAPCLFLLPCCGLPPFLVPYLDRDGPCLSPCLPSLCYIFPPQIHQKARKQQEESYMLSPRQHSA